MTITPDQIVLVAWGPVALNATILFTWIVMALLTLGAHLVTRRLSDLPPLTRRQNLLEVLVTGMRDQLAATGRRDPGKYLPFVGTLFLFIATSNLLAVVPGFKPPTGSLSTTTALALCVLIAVPVFGVAERGARAYLASYVKPTLLMLPFNILGELSRTLALAVRLYGNVMSGSIIALILLSVVPFVFPIVMQLLGLLTGLIQAYIFAVLAMVYIASASQSAEDGSPGSAASGTQPSSHNQGNLADD